MKINNMGKEQETEWAEAQKITVSVDLVEDAKTELKFLAAIDQSRFLFEDLALQRAVYRYNAFWLPLLAKHLENPISEESLVVPLDCELIWHCHRLNPVRYKFDCEKLFGRVLGNHKVISSIQATSTSMTKKIWNSLYPDEPYELDLNKPFSGDVLQKSKFTCYDLVSAVKRQIAFTSEVLSKPYMSDDLFLREAVARYKGFLHLYRKNKKMSAKLLGVPTIYIDLVWHTHQLHPDSYCKDMIELVGFVIHHDDDTTESDLTKGGKLDIGFSKTITMWEQIFGFSYQKFEAYRASGDHENESGRCSWYCRMGYAKAPSRDHEDGSGRCSWCHMGYAKALTSGDHENGSGRCAFCHMGYANALASGDHENGSARCCCRDTDENGRARCCCRDADENSCAYNMPKVVV